MNELSQHSSPGASAIRLPARSGMILCLLLAVAGCAAHQPPAPVVQAPQPAPPVQQALPDIPNPEEGFSLAMEAYKVGDMETAALFAQAVMARYPDTPWHKRSLFFLGRTRIAQDNSAEAESLLLRVPVEYPDLADYALFSLAEYYFTKTRYFDAAGLYQRLANDHQASQLVARASLRKAQALFEARSLPEAAEAFERVLKDFPRSEFAPDAGLAVGKVYAEMRDLNRACRAFLDVSVKYPGNSYDSEVERGLAGLKLLGAEIPKLTSEEHYERARNLFRTKQYDKAHESFSKALEADPVHPQRADILLRSGIALYYLGRRPEAASLLDRLLKARLPECRCDEALNWLGKAYSRLGLREEAVETFLKLVKSYPDSDWADDALYLIGNVYREAEDRSQAIKAYSRLAAQYPDSSFADSAIWWQGWAYYTAGEYKKSIQALQDIVKRYPRSWLVNQALYWQGRAAEKSGDATKAAVYYRKVLTRGPYTYYGYRAADRLMGIGLPVMTVSEDASLETADPGNDEQSSDPGDETDETDGPPVWTEDAVLALSANPSYRKILELMYLGMKREAAAELGSLQERTPARHSSLLGLSKAFFELEDYYRSLVIVLRNFDRLLERPSEKLPEDLWLLAYPQGYWNSIVTHARKYGLDPYFVAAIIREESQFHPEAVSPAGARGVMQVMPATGEWIARNANIPGFDRSKLFDSDTGINIGAWYVGHLMKKFRGDLVLVAAAYNAGPEPVSAWLEKNGAVEPDIFVESIPFLETRGYVKKVLRNYAEYKRIYGKGGVVTPLTLENPSGKTGASAQDEAERLCKALKNCP